MNEARHLLIYSTLCALNVLDSLSSFCGHRIVESVVVILNRTDQWNDWLQGTFRAYVCFSRYSNN